MFGVGSSQSTKHVYYILRTRGEARYIPSFNILYQVPTDSTLVVAQGMSKRIDGS